MYGNKKQMQITEKSPSQDWYILLFIYNLPLPCHLGGRKKKTQTKQFSCIR